MNHTKTLTAYDLYIAHIREAETENVEITNMGWVIDDDFIVSKTTLGLLESRIEDNRIMHEWSE